MKQIRWGSVTTIASLPKKLVDCHGATSSCPLTHGIFAWIAAQEAEDEGKKCITPWWRTLKVDKELNPKYPGGLREQAKRLRKEGHSIIKRKDRWFVQ